MTFSQDEILNALKKVKYPGYSRDIVSFGLIREVRVGEEEIFVALEITSADVTVAEALKSAVMAALKPFETGAKVRLEVIGRPPEPKVAAAVPKPQRLANVHQVVAVASGKGGVGKSTVAVRLALALRRMGVEVGLMDCDMYGPTVPMMLGLCGEPEVADGKLLPLVAHGLRVMSLGLLIDKNMPVVWRGPMVNKAVQQFITQVAWPKLDYLIIDLPPGTGDAHLTLMQTLVLDGVLVVTTPQRTAAEVALRGAQLFGKMEAPVLGVVENMSYYPLSGGRENRPFGCGGGMFLAKALGVKLWACLPVDSKLSEQADDGISAEATELSGPIYVDLAKKLMACFSSRS